MTRKAKSTHWLDKFYYSYSLDEIRKRAKPGEYIMRYEYALGQKQFLAVASKFRKRLIADPRFRVYERVPPARKPREKGGRDEVRELIIFADNESALYPQRVNIHKYFARKMKAGKYSAKKATILWGRWFDEAAKRYAQQHGTPGSWNQIFSKATRKLAARAYAAREASILRAGLRGETDEYVYKNPRNRWGRNVNVGQHVTAHHPRGGEISGVVKRIKRMSGYGLRAELDSGHSISLDDVKKARTKHAGKIPRVVFSPFADIRGSRVVFARDLFANRDSMHKNRWFVFGYSTDRQYGGHYVRRVAWPKDQPKKSRGFLRGFANQAEAKRVARALKRYARIKGLTK